MGGKSGGVFGGGDIGNAFEQYTPAGMLIDTFTQPGRDAAAASAKIAQAQLDEQRTTRAAATAAATPSLQELQQLQQGITLNQTDIDRKQKLLASADPALIEAGNQALALLQGKEAANLDPLKNQRAEGRTALQAQLRQQLGSGYATSSAGIEALRKYDESTSNALQTAQQQSLNSLLGITQGTESQGSLQSNISNSAALSQARGAINTRQVAAINGTPITMAGAQFAGDLLSAQNNAANMNTLLNLGTSLGTSAIAGGLSGGGSSGGTSALGNSPPALGSSYFANQSAGTGYNLGGNYQF